LAAVGLVQIALCERSETQPIALGDGPDGEATLHRANARERSFGRSGVFEFHKRGAPIRVFGALVKAGVPRDITVGNGRALLQTQPVPIIDHLFSIGRVRRMVWKFWYPFLTRRVRGAEVLFLNYAFEEDPPMCIPLSSEDEPNRACIQLYHHVATQVDLRGKNVLEVSCGHGGGASYLTRTQRPQRYTALDLNPTGIRFCTQRHHVDGLNFVQGDAEHLPFADETFDAVINVEASHCYPDFARFLAEVARVLRPGGHFLYADFRFADALAAWEQAIASTPLRLQHVRDIRAEVLRGMDRNSARSTGLIVQHLPKFLHSLARDFAGIKDSRIYNALRSGELSYRSYCFEKPRP
jgi:SAM-dependent methyltransferase